MEDAGVNPQDVEFYFHGCASPLNGSNYLTPNVQITNWFGMKGKGSIHHSEACCTGYLALEQAANAVASGKYDCVLTGAVEFGDSIPSPGESVEDQKHPYKRQKMAMEKFLKTTQWLYDRTYTRILAAGQELIYDDAAAANAGPANRDVPTCAIIWKRSAGNSKARLPNTLRFRKRPSVTAI